MSLLSVTVRFLCHVCSPLGPQLYTLQRLLPRDSARRGRKPKNVFMNAPQRIMTPIVSGPCLLQQAVGVLQSSWATFLSRVNLCKSKLGPRNFEFRRIDFIQ